MFVRCVKCNRSQWIEEGESATNLMFQQDEKERVHVFEKHTDLLSLQERTWSARTSNTTLPTANHLQPGHSDKQPAATPHSSMARTSLLKSDEGRGCTICGVVARFTCPQCSSPFCHSHSREHQTSYE